MKKHFKHTILLVGCAAMLAGCDENEWNDKLDGFEVPPVYTDTETYNYTLTAADYTSIANSKVNKAIAEAKGESAVTALAAIGTNACFATAEEAREYIPALLSLTTFPYFTAENVKITYDLTSNQLPEVLAINAGVKTYDVTKADYQSLWGSTEDFIMGFAPATGKAEKILPELLAKKYTDAEAGEYAVVNYNYTDEDPDFNAGTTYFEETFAASIGEFKAENILLPDGYDNIWSYDSYGYVKVTSYLGGKNLASDSWLVSPEINLPADANASLSFDQAWRYFSDVETAKKEFSVGIRIVGESSWNILTPEAFPTNTNWTFANSGAISIADFNGKKIQIGFHYTSTDSKSGTAEIKNVKVFAGSAPVTENRYAIYTFDGNSWVVPGSMSILQGSDYAAMGYGENNYITVAQAKTLLPAYLAVNLPYAQEDASQVVVFRSSTSKVSAMQLVHTDGVWVPDFGTSVDQFSKNKGNWEYNPSVVITLPYSRNTDPSYTYYMGCVNWVFENISKEYGVTNISDGGGFLDSRGNAEFYSGASAYYGNVDVRAITAKNNAPDGYTGYDGLTDDEISFLVKKRFCLESMRGSLEQLHPDAKPADGMEMTYTINFVAYTGSPEDVTLVYTVSAPGKFTYKSCTWFEEGEDADWE